MKTLLILTSFIALSVHSFSADTIPTFHEHIEYTGRIDFTDSTAPAYAYSGISIRMGFTGTSVSAILNSDNSDSYYNVIVDGRVRDIIHLKSGLQTYALAKDLEDIEHEIELFKRTEHLFGSNQFLGFIIDQGESSIPCQPRQYFIEFIGNSITCGYGNEGENGEQFTAETENHYQTYAAITSRNFNARHLAVCFSGKGMYRNYAGPPEGTPDNMPNHYNRIFFDQEQPLYNFNTQPDVICINLGTNDFSTPGADSALYVDAYLRFIDTLQTKYNNPNIVCLLGSMLGGNTLNNVRSYLQFVTDSANKKDKGQVTFFEMSQQGDLGIGVHNHPNVPQNHKNAGELTEYLRSLMNWKVHALLVSAHTIDEHHIELKFNTDIFDTENKYVGFQLSSPGKTYTISNVFRDTENQSILQLQIEEEISFNEDVYLNYMPGTIYSKDTIALGTINNLTVKNTVPEPANKVMVHDLRGIEVFPNPTSSKIVNYSFNKSTFQETKYKLVSSTGTVVQEGSLMAPSGQLNLHELSYGFYVIQFIQKDYRFSETLVLQGE